MKIITYNMRLGGAGKSQWAKIIEEHDPAILLAQESYVPDEHLPPLLHGDLADKAVWQSVDGLKWGSAVYLRGERPRRIELSDYSGNVVGAEVESFNLAGEAQPLQIFSVHAPKRVDYKNAVNEILDMILRVRNRGDIIIGGDFNLTVSKRHNAEARPDDPRDLAIQARLRDEFGLINCWQESNPGVPLAQTLRWSKDKTEPYHCDGIFVPETWANQLKMSVVLSGDEWVEMSDHNPVVAVFASECDPSPRARPSLPIIT